MVDVSGQYDLPEYEFLRRMAMLMREWSLLQATSPRGQNIDLVMQDMSAWVKEDLDEF
jgi:hypothetical protein